jgi:branched-chain amino acid transport system permease protein
MAEQQSRERTARLKRGAWAAFVMALITLPFWVPDAYVFRVVTLVALYTIPALAQNLITGFTGILTVGQSANLAVGAYTSVLLVMRFNVPWPIAFLAAGLLSAGFGLLLGIPCLRLGGDYLTLMTIGFAEITRIVILNWMEVTRGPMGIPGVPPPAVGGFVFNTSTRYYYLVLCAAAIAYLVAYRLVHSYVGRALMAVRDDEVAAGTAGVDLPRYKLLAFVVSTLYVGFAGSLLAHFLRFVGPGNFTMDESLLHMQMALLGGFGSLPGSILGAAIMIALPEMLRILQEYRLLFNGVVLIILMAWRPQGILGVGAWGRGGTGWRKLLHLEHLLGKGEATD